MKDSPKRAGRKKGGHNSYRKPRPPGFTMSRPRDKEPYIARSMLRHGPMPELTNRERKRLLPVVLDAIDRMGGSEYFARIASKRPALFLDFLYRILKLEKETPTEPPAPGGTAATQPTVNLVFQRISENVERYAYLPGQPASDAGAAPAAAQPAEPMQDQ